MIGECPSTSFSFSPPTFQTRSKKWKMKISGEQLEQLKRFTWMMVEAYGLDQKIEKYKGARPIGFWRWDLDCLVDVTSMALEDEEKYPDQSSEEYQAMEALHERIKKLWEKAYGRSR